MLLCFLQVVEVDAHYIPMFFTAFAKLIGVIKRPDFTQFFSKLTVCYGIFLLVFLFQSNNFKPG